MKKQLYSLFERKLKNGKVIWYYSCYDSDGSRKQYSTGKTDKQDAIVECHKRLSLGGLVLSSKLNFKKYTDKWFIWGLCPYYGPRIDKGRIFSRSNMDRKRGVLEKNILPYFSNINLNKITTENLEDWLVKMKQEGYATATINNYFSIIKMILNEALRCGHIKFNPCNRVITFYESSKERGILTRKENDALFNDDDSLHNIWDGNTKHYLINKLASISGLRQGEIIALKKDCIKESYLIVKHSWDRKYGLTTTKSKNTRYVPIPKHMYIELIEYSLSHKSEFIFPGKKIETPVSHKTIDNHFKTALTRTGINEIERKKRNIVFHGYRHYCSTILRESGVNPSIAMELLGHKSLKVNDIYTHINTKDIEYDSLNIM